MSSSAPRGGERAIHQDFMARIRYSNPLPPPPNPPKLLDIPNTGLSSGQYTTPGFASRMAREQPLNIEVDAELGMPLDLVGMPGIFDGDESSIQAPAQTPQVHPHDRPLLRPLATLGKPQVAEAAVSFLRRTEYISSAVTKKSNGFLRPNANTTPNRNTLKRRSPEPEAGTPAFVKRKINHSFDIAAKNLKDKANVRHPTKRKAVTGSGPLRCVGAYPLLPDLEAFPDSGAYVTIRFSHAPTQDPQGGYDARLLSGILKPNMRTAEEEELLTLMAEAHARDPDHNPKPPALQNYDYYLTDTAEASKQFRDKYNTQNPNKDDEDLYTDETQEGEKCFKFERIRGYETKQDLELDHTTKWGFEVILSFEEGRAMYYPVMGRTIINTQRGKQIQKAMTGVDVDDEEAKNQIDTLEVTVEDQKPDMVAYIERYKVTPMGPFDDEEEAEADAEEEETAEGQLQEENGMAEDVEGAGRAANGGYSAAAAADSDEDAGADED